MRMKSNKRTCPKNLSWVSAHLIDLARVGALRLEDKGEKAYPWISISSLGCGSAALVVRV